MAYSPAVGNKVREIRQRSQRVVDKRRPHREESSNSIVSKSRLLAELAKKNLTVADFRWISDKMKKVWEELSKSQAEATDTDLASDQFTVSWNDYRSNLVKKHGELIVAAAFARFDGGFRGV